MSAASKHRQPRLRASCDGCFLAKVKCSKARPICSRCLACGIECRYSPSSRAGKPKSDNSNSHNHNHNNNNNHHHHHHHSTPIQQEMAAVTTGFSASMTDDKTGLMYAAAAVPGLYRLDTGWQTPVNIDVPQGSAISRNHSISSELALLAMDGNTAAAAMAAAAANGDMYATGPVPWTTSPTDLSVAQFADSPMSVIPMHAAVTHGNFSMTAAASAASVMPWMDPSAMDMFPYGQGQPMQGHGHPQPPPPPPYQHQQQEMPTPGSIASSTVNNYFPSPSTTPSLRQSPATGHKSVPLSSSSSGVGGGGSVGYAYHSNSPASCVCFTACLHALQALHNASTPTAPPFDVVLSLNRNAVEGCAAMLACPRCMRRSGTHTASMLLATLLGKITSFYKTASQSYFRPMTRMGDGNHGETVDALPEEPEAASTRAPPPTDNTSPTTSVVAGLGLGVSLGVYQLQGEDGRWLELEILNRELKKLEEVYARFREVCGDLLFEDVAVSKAMIGYLGQTLGAALDLVNHRKEDLQFV